MNSKIDELLIDWEIARQDGSPVSAEELCRDCPELLDELKTRIQGLSKTSWLFKDDTEPAAQPNSQLSTAEILSRIKIEKLVDPSNLAEPESETSAEAYLDQLIEANLINDYHKKVLLGADRGPLSIDRYLILGRIGSGGMGEVFRAQHRTMVRDVALKILPPDSMRSPDRRARFAREIEAVSKLNHPNIVTAYDANEHEGRTFLAMELVDGEDLEKKVERDGPLDEPTARKMIAQIADALHSAHEAGIVHRDVKPSNILVTDRRQTPKLADLGLARFRQEVAEDKTPKNITGDQVPMGTVAYMSPEQAMDARTANEQSDIYSLGCTYLYLLTGKPPFASSNPFKTIVAHREKPVAEVLAEANVSGDSKRLLSRMLAKNPKDRFGDMAEVAEAFAPTAAKTSENSKLFRTVSLAVAAFGLLYFAVRMMFPTTPPDQELNQRVLAQRVLGEGGIVTVVTQAGTVTLHGGEDELVEGALDIKGLSLGPIQGDLPLYQISQLKNLESLELIDVELSATQSLDMEKMKALSSLAFDHCYVDIRIFELLTRLPRLKRLAIRNMELSRKDAMAIGTATQVSALSMENVSLSDKSFRQSFAKTNYQSLQLIDTRVGASALLYAEGKGVKKLDLTGSAVDDEDMKTARAPRSLRVLVVGDCKVGSGIADYCANCPDLKELHCHDTQLGDAALITIISQCSNLEYLDIERTLVTDEGLAKLQDLPRLSGLDLSNLNVDDESMDYIAVLEQLLHLRLGNTRVTDEGFLKLAGVGLETLEVFGNQISEQAFDDFSDLNPECDIYLVEMVGNVIDSWA